MVQNRNLLATSDNGGTISPSLSPIEKTFGHLITVRGPRFFGLSLLAGTRVAPSSLLSRFLTLFVGTHSCRSSYVLCTPDPTSDDLGASGLGDGICAGSSRTTLHPPAMLSCGAVATTFFDLRGVSNSKLVSVPNGVGSGGAQPFDGEGVFDWPSSTAMLVFCLTELVEPDPPWV